MYLFCYVRKYKEKVECLDLGMLFRIHADCETFAGQGSRSAIPLNKALKQARTNWGDQVTQTQPSALGKLQRPFVSG